jgi:hypothetical protein
MGANTDLFASQLVSVGRSAQWPAVVMQAMHRDRTLLGERRAFGGRGHRAKQWKH